MAAAMMVLAPFAAAQGGPAVTGVPGEKSALSLSLYGELDLQMRYGNSGFMAGNGLGANDPFWIGSPKLTLGLEAKLADKASAVIELMTPRVLGGTPVNYFGSENSGGAAIEVEVRKAYLKLPELIVSDLTVTFGIQEVVFDIVGNNNPLVIALGRAESATAEWAKLGSSSVPGNAFDELPAGGIRLDYNLGAAGTITAFHMIVQLGNLQDMEAITGVDVMYKVTEKTTVEGLVALINGAAQSGTGAMPDLSGKNSEIWLLGIGAASNGEFVDNLKLFGQAYFNTGTYGSFTDVADNTQDVKARGYMFDFGANYQLADVAWKPAFGIEYLHVSGVKSTDLDNKKYSGFVSYEDNNDLIVIEDKEFGFDIDQNYRAIKIRASATGDVAGPVKDNFTLEALVGITSLVNKVTDVNGKKEGDLGTELDIKASWMASKQVKVYAGTGILFGSDVLKNVIDPAIKESTAFTLFVGTNVRF
jgi:hypothetical protein